MVYVDVLHWQGCEREWLHNIGGCASLTEVTAQIQYVEDKILAQVFYYKHNIKCRQNIRD